jgi:hypothetical protein
VEERQWWWCGIEGQAQLGVTWSKIRIRLASSCDRISRRQGMTMTLGNGKALSTQTQKREKTSERAAFFTTGKASSCCRRRRLDLYEVYFRRCYSSHLMFVSTLSMYPRRRKVRRQICGLNLHKIASINHPLLPSPALSTTHVGTKAICLSFDSTAHPRMYNTPS